MGSCLFETFRWDLKQDILFEMFETWNFSNMSWELLIWNFQMRFEMRCAIWNFWNLKLLKHVMGVAYLKLSDETWKRGAIWNFSNLKLFKPIMGSCLFETFRWDLKQDILFEMFETWNFSNMSWELLIWNFQMRFEMRCAIWNFWNLKLFKHIMGCCLFETFRWDLKGDVLFKFWNILSFSNPSQELLIWNFQMRLETIYSIWYVWNLKLFKHVIGVAYLKLSDETWNEMCYMKLLNLKLFKPIIGSCLFETFRWDLKKRCYLNFLKLVTFQIHHGELLI